MTPTFTRSCLLFIACCAAVANSLYAQTISTTNGAPYNTPNYLVENVLVSGCLDISNITYAGALNAIGYFSNGSSLGIEEGIVLTTGNINNIANGAAGFASTTWLAAGDPQLASLMSFPSNDAAVLEFDFKPLSNTVSFDYVFASEEYPEWVGSAFNDVFGFFVTGPGVATNQNIAVLPGTSTPVGINFVNNGNANAGPCVNCSYYISNGGTQNVFDAYTTVLTATVSGLTPCETYHIKIAICDTQDWSFDSAVFLAANSFTAGEAIDITAEVPNSNTGGADAYEACQQGFFTFTRDPNGDLSQPLVLNLNVSGTAISGTDYIPLPTTVTIPAGESSVQIPVTAIGDLIVEGYESVTVALNNFLCNCTTPPPATLNIYDSAEIFEAFSSSDITICPGDDVLIAVIASGSPFVPYTYQWSNGGAFPAIFVAPTTTTTYTVTITDGCGRTTTEPVTVTVVNQAPDASITAPASVCATDAPMLLNANTDGGIWSGPGVNVNSGLFDPAVAAALGQNPITVTYSINNSCGSDQDQVQIYIYSAGDPVISAPPPLCAEPNNTVMLTTDKPGGVWSGEGIVGGTNTTGQFDPQLAQSTGTPPYTVTYTLTGNCGGTATANVSVNPQPTATLSGNITVCSSSSPANLNIALSGVAPFIVVYAIDGINQPAINIATSPYALAVSQAATYTITSVIDANGCTNTGNGIGTLQYINIALNATTTPPVCVGSSNGEINLSVTGNATAPLTYAWSNAAIGNTPNAMGLNAGVYSATVTDQNGCTATISTTLDNPPPLDALATPNSVCSNTNSGTIDIAMSNGAAPFTYVWSNAAIGNTPNAINLGAGTYNTTITDQNGCTATTSANIDALPLPTPAIDAPANICAGGDATIGIQPAFAQYAWSTTATTQQITTTAAGIYAATVTDQNGCTASVSHTLDVTALSLTATANAALCNGSASGSINTTFGGGTAPISYTWSPGVGDIANPTNLTAATYSVTATDGNGCTATAQATVSEATALALAVQTADATCNGTATGSIDLAVSGGTPNYTLAWSGGLAAQANHNATVAAGTYSVTATDSNGCTATLGNIIIGEPPAISLLIDAQNILCFNKNDGIATAIPIGGVAPYNFVWSNGQTNAIAANLAANDYVVTVTDANACSQTAQTTITQPNALSLDATVQNPACADNNNGYIALLPDGGTLPYSFNWSNGTTDQNLDNLAANTYSVTISDANNCSDTAEFTLTAPLPLVIQSDTGNPNCATSNDGFIQLTVSGGTEPYTYDWDNPLNDNTAVQNNLAAGFQTVVVGDANACQQTLTFDLVAPNALSSSVATNPSSCPTAANGSIDLSVSGGTAPYGYDWDGILPDIEDPSDVLAGTYGVVVADANGCTTTAEATITAGAGITATATTNPSSCPTAANGSIDLSVSGGTAPYAYDWDGILPDIEDPSGVLAGTYGVVVADANGCTTTAEATITAGINLSISGTVMPPNCQLSADGQIELSITDGSAPYTFDWSSTLMDTQNPNNAAAGNYTVSVTDANGCSNTATFDVTAPPALIASHTTTAATCNGAANGSIDLNAIGGTAPYTYNWSGTLPDIEDPSGVTAGTYSATVTDNNGCTTTIGDVVVAEPTALSLVLNTNPATCGNADGDVQATLTGGTAPYSYDWSGTLPDIANPNGVAAGTYSVTVADNNGCTATAAISVSNQDGPTIILLDAQNTVCSQNNGSITLQINASTTYSVVWNNGSTTETIDNLMAGTYTVTVTDSNNCDALQTITLTDAPAPILNITDSNNATCGNANGSIELGVLGGTSPIDITWSHDAALNDILANNLPDGTYTATATDANGCTANTTATLSNSPNPEIVLANQIDETCNSGNGSLVIDASGGTGNISYDWTGANSDTNIASNLLAGTYSVTVSDELGCTATAEFNLDNAPAPTLSIVDSTNPACNQANGALIVAANGGAEPYTYAIDATPQDNGIFNNLTAASYTVTVTDANGCTTTTNGVLTDLAGVTISSIASTDAFCGNNNGTITVSVSGGTLPLSYAWSGTSSTAATANNLAAGGYTVTVTDNNGCSASAAATIAQHAAPILNLIQAINANCGDSNGAASISASGEGTLSYAWSGGVAGNVPEASGLAAGTYSVTVTDGNSCTAALPIVISNEGAPTIDNITITPATCSQANGEAVISASGGVGILTYTWTNDVSNSNTATNLMAGTYYITVSDDNNCQTITTAIVSGSEPPQLSIASVSNASCGNNNGAASIEVTGGTGILTYTWTNNVSDNATANNLPTGAYGVTVSDANGCSSSLNIDIATSNAPTIDTANIATPTCGNNNGIIELTITGGTPPMAYIWEGSTSNNNTADNLATGEYSITVSDANGCTATWATTLEGTSAIDLITNNITPTTCGNDNGTAALSASGGTEPYTWDWTDEVSNSGIAANLAAGSYGITVSDANGCNAITNIDIANSSAPLVAESENIPATCNESNGSLSVSVSGGVTPYSYTWADAAINSETALNLAAGNYAVTVTDNNGCTNSLAMTVQNQNAPTATATATPTDCGTSGGTATITANGGIGGYSYVWNSTPPQNTATATGLLPGNYSATVTDSNGCAAIAAATVSGIITNPIVQCSNSTDSSVSVVWTAVSGAEGYQISINGIAIDTIAASTTTYTVEGLGVQESVSISVVALSSICGNSAAVTQTCMTNGCLPLAITLNNPATILCADANSVQLSGLPASGIWSGNGISPDGNFDPNAAGIGIHTLTYTYTDTASNCSYTETTTIEVAELPLATITMPEYLCVGETATLSLGSTAPPDAVFTWQIGTQTDWSNAPMQTIIGETIGQQFVQLVVSNAAGCSDTAAAVLPISAATVSTIADMTVLVGTPVILTTTATSGLGGTLSYTWASSAPNGNLSCTDCLLPTATPNETSTYTITTTDSYGCTAADEVTITVVRENAVIMPNVFSPNGDGLNDIFRIQGQNIATARLQIRDRWGNELYIADIAAASLADEGWRGIYKDGQEAELGVYAYYATITFADGHEEFIKGNVTLLR